MPSTKATCRLCGRLMSIQRDRLCYRCHARVYGKRVYGPRPPRGRPSAVPNRVDCGRPPKTSSAAGGLTLLTLHDEHEAAAERGRRAALYARQVEEFGEIRWGELPPPGEE